MRSMKLEKWISTLLQNDIRCLNKYVLPGLTVYPCSFRNNVSTAHHPMHSVRQKKGSRA